VQALFDGHRLKKKKEEEKKEGEKGGEGKDEGEVERPEGRGLAARAGGL